MAVGGPAIGFTAGLLEGLARARQHAIASNRFQVEFALKQLKERKQEEEAIRKEWAAYQKAQIEYAAAQRELDLATEHRRQVETSTGKPYRDAAIEGRLAEAHERLETLTTICKRQGKLQDLISEQDARVRGALHLPMAPRLAGMLAAPSTRVSRHATTEDDRQKAIDERKAEIREGEMEQQAEFNSRLTPSGARSAGCGGSNIENAKIKGFETAEEEGRKRKAAERGNQARQAICFRREIEGIRRRRDVYMPRWKPPRRSAAKSRPNWAMPPLPPRPGAPVLRPARRADGRPAPAITGKGGAMAQPPTRIGGRRRNRLTWRFPRRPGAMQDTRLRPAQQVPASRGGLQAPRLAKLFPGCREASADAVAASHCNNWLCAWGRAPGGLCGQGRLWSGRHGAPWRTLAETSEQSHAIPQQGSGGTTHFHFHQRKPRQCNRPARGLRSLPRTAQPPTGMQGQSGRYPAPMPPRRPDDFQGQGGTTLEPSYQPTRRAMDEPAMEWYHAHPEVPESEAGKYAPHHAPAQARTDARSDAGTIMNGYRFKAVTRAIRRAEQAPRGRLMVLPDSPE